jgi:outer membrane protein TolC
MLTAQTTLSGYIESVVDYNISLTQAALSSEAAEWELRQARKGHLPTVGFDRTASIDFAHNSAGRAWSWATHLEARQLIYGGGGITARRRAQELQLRVQNMGEVLRLRGVRREAERAYWRLSHAEEYLRSMSYYRAIIDTLRGVVERRYEEGYSPKGDLLQIESRLSDVEYQLSAAKQEYDRALQNFNSLCNNPLEQPTTLHETILSSASTPTRCDIEAMIINHPERRTAAYIAEQGRMQVRTTNARYMPQVGLSIYGTLEPKQPHTSTSGLRLGGGAMLNISSTIFHFGERHAAVQAARAEQLKLELEIEAISDALRLAEGDAWTTLVRTNERREALERSLSIASENLEISTYAYGEGQTSILDVMQAQISWLQTYKNYLAAHYDYALAQAEYRYLTRD